MVEMIDKKTGEIFEVITANENGELVLAKQAHDAIVFYESMMKQFKQEYDEYKKALLEAMEENGVKQIKNDDFTVTYVAPTERVSLDSKMVEMQYPRIFNECSKVSSVKSSVRVKMK